MQNKTILIYIVISTLFISTSCSTRKDTVFSRSSHALATEYNILFNGYNGYNEGERQLLSGLGDDFTKLLSVDRFEPREDEKIEVFIGDIKDSNFKKAEEKATKAIQKHSMNIDNRERNPQTDEAFMLLGKTRYFSKRFMPSQEAFEYIIYNYPDSDKMVEARIWREKTNIQLYKEQIAITNLKKIFRQEIVTPQNYSEIMATMAEAYVKLEHLDSAYTVLKTAAEITKQSLEKGRYNYILGQLSNTLKNPGRAQFHFNKVVALNRRIPRVYLVNAEIELIKLTSLNIDRNRKMVYEKLQKMLINRENRPYLDIIHRQMALYYLHSKNFKQTELSFQNSTKITKNKSIKVLNYIDLAKMHFDIEHYPTTSKYYDSIIANITPKDDRYYITVKKREHIKNIVKYELISQRDDSILKLAKMLPEAQNRYFKEYVAQLRLSDEKKQQKLENEKKRQEEALNTIVTGTNSIFYFYNSAAINQGKKYFTETWGSRPLKDNWKYVESIDATTPISSAVTPETQNATAAEQIPSPEKNEKYKIDTYISKIPKEKEILDSIRTELNLSYYQLGILYKDKFKNYKRAEEKLKLLLANKPLPELELPVKYNLYKIYKETQNNRAAEPIKADILKNYPESSFAKVLENKNFDEEKEINTGEKLYAELYRKFKNEEFEAVITLCDENIPKLFGNDVIPKILMLRASAVARLHGLSDYEKALKQVISSYPSSFEAKAAQNLLDEMVSTWLKKEIDTLSSTGKYWKVVFAFEKTDTIGFQKVSNTIDAIINDFSYDQLHISKDVFTDQQDLLVVHGFSDKERAQGFQELLKVNKQYYIERKNFVLSSRNYEMLQVNKNIREFTFK